MNELSRPERIYRLSQELQLGEKLLEELRIDSPEILHECEFVDYKREIDHSKTGMAKTVKDIVALHNSYGGYLVVGVGEVQKDQEYCIVGVGEPISIEKLRGSISRYTGRKLNVRLANHELEGNTVTVIHVPKRVGRAVCFERDAALDSVLVFSKDQTVFRDGDEVKLALNADDWEFLNSRREYPRPSIVSPSRQARTLPHNLPDRNLICSQFVGRGEIISRLWAWLGDEFEYLKILAGEGGRGKTSIAYEFATQVALSGDNEFEYVLWLTAKKRHFVALRDQYTDIVESHFDSPESLLRSISYELGDQDEYDSESLISMKKSARGALQDSPALVVVDNVDSLEFEDQRRVIDFLRQIIGQSASRILVTTRRDPTLSPEQCIEVPGFPEDEFEQFVGSLCDRYVIPALTKKEASRLFKVSDGSPVFTESILRLVRNGEKPNKAMQDWQNEAGDTVRNAVLKREIEQLSPEARRVLYAIAQLDTASLTELRQITRYEENVLRECIDQLTSLFLVQAPRIIETERRFRVPTSTSRLLVDLKGELVDRNDEIDRRVSKLQEGVSPSHAIGAAVRQAMAMIRVGEYTDAHATVDALLAQESFERNSDLLLLKGRIYKAQGDLDGSRNSFKRAFDAGCSKDLLFDLWFESEMDADHAQGMFLVSDNSLARGDYVDKRWIYRRAESNVRRAVNSAGSADKRQLLNSAADDLSTLIRNEKGSKRKEYRSNLHDLHDLIFSTSGDNLEHAISEILTAFDRGDHRLNLFKLAGDWLFRMADTGRRGGRAPSNVRKQTEAFLDRLSAHKKNYVKEEEKISVIEEKLYSVLAQL